MSNNPAPTLDEILKGLQRRLHPTGRTALRSPKDPHYKPDRLDLVPSVVCKSGFTFSMQASRFHYCEPRDDIGPWTEVELSALSKHMPLLDSYAHDATDDNNSNTIYGWVPLKEVAELVLKEGGFA